MGQAKHTPGPWKIHEHGVGFEVECANGNVVAQAQQVTTLRQDPTHSERKANARLIAAAPDQHEALCCAPVLSMYHGPNGFEQERFIKDYETWNEQKRAAIAKATGTTQ